jgi:DNA-binding HxlR family transcriptional regulator
MKAAKPPLKSVGFLNVSIHREVLTATQDFLSAVIIGYIHYRVIKNDRKPVWLKVDWILDALPYISRAGLAKKLDKLVEDGHIIKKAGEGRHYHKCWYSLSPEMREYCSGKSLADSAKVYYNEEIAKDNLEAAVVCATIVNLLKVEEVPLVKVRGLKKKVGMDHGRTDNALLLDYTKLAEGSGLTIGKIRKAVRWLIEKKKIQAKSVFGNKRVVSLPADTLVQPVDLRGYSADELPTESYPHGNPGEDEPTECYEQ